MLLLLSCCFGDFSDLPRIPLSLLLLLVVERRRIGRCSVLGDGDRSAAAAAERTERVSAGNGCCGSGGDGGASVTVRQRGPAVSPP